MHFQTRFNLTRFKLTSLAQEIGGNHGLSCLEHLEGINIIGGHLKRLLNCFIQPIYFFGLVIDFITKF